MGLLLSKQLFGFKSLIWSIRYISVSHNFLDVRSASRLLLHLASQQQPDM